jgi:hypothetical protein
MIFFRCECKGKILTFEKYYLFENKDSTLNVVLRRVIMYKNSTF